MIFILKFHRATGYFSGKIGRFAAITVGGSIILLQIANEQGIVKLDWCKLSKKADELGDKVQEAVTGEGPRWMDKVKNFIKSGFLWYLSSIILKQARVTRPYPNLNT